jgi:hypothetical protein
MTMTILRGTLIAFVPMLLLLIGCGDKSGRTQSDSTTATTSEAVTAAASNAVCYRQVLGRDTTTVRLLVTGSTVTGELAVLPAEKDRATGAFSGTLTNDRVVGDWQRLGEGVTQTHEVNFTMAGDSLLWREGERVEKNGKWVLTNPDKGFQYVLTKVDCR